MRLDEARTEAAFSHGPVHDGEERVMRETPYATTYAMRALLAVAVALCAFLFAASPALAETFDVNSTLDLPDANTANNVCDALTLPNATLCTLRAAIQQSNVTPGKDTITFSIGSGPQTITPLSPLPSVNNLVDIDGTTQEGFDPDTDQPIIELSGQSLGGSADGLVFTSRESTLRGLVINRFGGDGVFLTGPDADNIQISGNYIGTDLTGEQDLGNGGAGVLIQDVSGNTVGGSTAADRNVISSNGRSGVVIQSIDRPPRAQRHLRQRGGRQRRNRRHHLVHQFRREQRDG